MHHVDVDGNSYGPLKDASPVIRQHVMMCAKELNIDVASGLYGYEQSEIEALCADHGIKLTKKKATKKATKKKAATVTSANAAPEAPVDKDEDGLLVVDPIVEAKDEVSRKLKSQYGIVLTDERLDALALPDLHKMLLAAAGPRDAAKPKKPRKSRAKATPTVAEDTTVVYDGEAPEAE